MLNKLILFIFLFIVGMTTIFFSQVPFEKVNELEKGFVKTSVSKDDVNYKIVKTRPASWVRIKDLDKHVYMAIVISEDWAFFDHHGIDPRQIYEAMKEAATGGRVRGASTISQQVVKNLFTEGRKTIWRKVKELLTTMYLEDRLSKNKILEVYLNIIQYGENLYGIENASNFYFGTRAKYLTVKEAAFLAMLLPSPVRYAQSYHDGKLTEFASGIIEQIISKLVRAKVVDKDQAEYYRMDEIYFNK